MPNPCVLDIETPLGVAEQIWSTSEYHISSRGEYRINGVDYHVRVDMYFRDGIWQLGSEDNNVSRWDCVYIRRANWDYLRGRCPDPSSSARAKVQKVLVPWLAKFALSDAGQEITNAAGIQKREQTIRSAHAKVKALNDELAEAQAELRELQELQHAS